MELDTVGLGITPTAEKYTVAIDALLESMRDQRLTGIAEVTQAFRRQYYELVKRTLREQRQVIPCMAGVASAQIAPNGDVWTCCIRAQSMGNLREHGLRLRLRLADREGRPAATQHQGRRMLLPAGQCRLHEHAHARSHRHEGRG